MNNLSKDYIFDSSHLNGMHLAESFGKYKISCKAGYYCDFNITQISNQPHFHNCYELYIVTAGEGSFLNGGQPYTVKQWDIFIADPGVIHEISVHKLQDLQLIYFHIDIEADELVSIKTASDLSVHNFLKGHKVIARAQKHLLAYLLFFDVYFKEKKSKGYGMQQAYKSLILESLDSLSLKADNLVLSLTSASNTFELALDYIDQNLNRRTTISQIAKELNVSERTLQLLFRKHMNSTVIDYINKKKMILASYYLMKQFSVTETSNQIGIQNTAQFSRLFKKYIGVTPKKYQQQHIAKIRDFGRRQHILQVSDHETAQR